MEDDYEPEERKAVSDVGQESHIEKKNGQPTSATRANSRKSDLTSVDEDDDEDLQLALALSASLAEAKHPKPPPLCSSYCQELGGTRKLRICAHTRERGEGSKKHDKLQSVDVCDSLRGSSPQGTAILTGKECTGRGTSSQATPSGHTSRSDCNSGKTGRKGTDRSEPTCRKSKEDNCSHARRSSASAGNDFNDFSFDSGKELSASTFNSSLSSDDACLNSNLLASIGGGSSISSTSNLQSTKDSGGSSSSSVGGAGVVENGISSSIVDKGVQFSEKSSLSGQQDEPQKKNAPPFIAPSPTSSVKVLHARWMATCSVAGQREMLEGSSDEDDTQRRNVFGEQRRERNERRRGLQPFKEDIANLQAEEQKDMEKLVCLREVMTEKAAVSTRGKTTNCKRTSAELQRSTAIVFGTQSSVLPTTTCDASLLALPYHPVAADKDPASCGSAGAVNSRNAPDLRRESDSAGGSSSLSSGSSLFPGHSRSLVISNKSSSITRCSRFGEVESSSNPNSRVNRPFGVRQTGGSTTDRESSSSSRDCRNKGHASSSSSSAAAFTGERKRQQLAGDGEIQQENSGGFSLEPWRPLRERSASIGSKTVAETPDESTPVQGAAAALSSSGDEEAAEMLQSATRQQQRLRKQQQSAEQQPRRRRSALEIASESTGTEPSVVGEGKENETRGGGAERRRSRRRQRLQGRPDGKTEPHSTAERGTKVKKKRKRRRRSRKEDEIDTEAEKDESSVIYETTTTFSDAAESPTIVSDDGDDEETQMQVALALSLSAASHPKLLPSHYGESSPFTGDSSGRRTYTVGSSGSSMRKGLSAANSGTRLRRASALTAAHGRYYRTSGTGRSSNASKRNGGSDSSNASKSNGNSTYGKSGRTRDSGSDENNNNGESSNNSSSGTGSTSSRKSSSGGGSSSNSSVGGSSSCSSNRSDSGSSSSSANGSGYNDMRRNGGDGRSSHNVNRSSLACSPLSEQRSRNECKGLRTSSEDGHRLSGTAKGAQEREGENAAEDPALLEEYIPCNERPRLRKKGSAGSHSFSATSHYNIEKDQAAHLPSPQKQIAVFTIDRVRGAESTATPSVSTMNSGAAGEESALLSDVARSVEAAMSAQGMRNGTSSSTGSFYRTAGSIIRQPPEGETADAAGEEASTAAAETAMEEADAATLGQPEPGGGTDAAMSEPATARVSAGAANVTAAATQTGRAAAASARAAMNMRLGGVCCLSGDSEEFLPSDFSSGSNFEPEEEAKSRRRIKQKLLLHQRHHLAQARQGRQTLVSELEGAPASEASTSESTILEDQEEEKEGKDDTDDSDEDYEATQKQKKKRRRQRRGLTPRPQPRRQEQQRMQRRTAREGGGREAKHLRRMSEQNGLLSKSSLNNGAETEGAEEAEQCRFRSESEADEFVEAAPANESSDHRGGKETAESGIQKQRKARLMFLKVTEELMHAFMATSSAESRPPKCSPSAGVKPDFHGTEEERAEGVEDDSKEKGSLLRRSGNISEGLLSKRARQVKIANNRAQQQQQSKKEKELRSAENAAAAEAVKFWKSKKLQEACLYIWAVLTQAIPLPVQTAAILRTDIGRSEKVSRLLEAIDEQQRGQQQHLMGSTEAQETEAGNGNSVVVTQAPSDSQTKHDTRLQLGVLPSAAPVEQAVTAQREPHRLPPPLPFVTLEQLGKVAAAAGLVNLNVEELLKMIATAAAAAGVSSTAGEQQPRRERERQEGELPGRKGRSKKQLGVLGGATYCRRYGEALGKTALFFEEFVCFFHKGLGLKVESNGKVW